MSDAGFEQQQQPLAPAMAVSVGHARTVSGKAEAQKISTAVKTLETLCNMLMALLYSP